MRKYTPFPFGLDVVYKRGGGPRETTVPENHGWTKRQNEGRGTVFSGTLMITSWPSEGK